MGSLTGSLFSAMSALNADQTLINITGNNIANVDNPDYSREQAQVIEQDTARFGNLNVGTGVRLEGIVGVRDAALNLRIAAESSQQAASNAYLGAVQQLEPAYASGNTDGIDSQLNSFWSAWNQLSPDPSNPSLRQQAISAGQSLANSLQQSSKQISDLSTSLDQGMEDSTNQANTLLKTIAQLNVAAAQSGGEDPSITDRQDSAVAKLSGLLDISVIRGSNGMVQVTTQSGNPLVVDNQASSLQFQANGGGAQLLLKGTDVTSQINNGAIGGALEARNVALPALQARLDLLANSLTSAVNTAYQGNFFVSLSQVPGSATAIAVAASDPAQLQTGLSGAPGDNSIVNAISALQSQPVVNGISATEYQAQTVFALGNDVANAQASSDSSKAVITQMNSQRAAISGVSLDQEAANLMQFQRSYQAAARIISTVDSMMQTAIGMGSNH